MTLFYRHNGHRVRFRENWTIVSFLDRFLPVELFIAMKPTRGHQMMAGHTFNTQLKSRSLWIHLSLVIHLVIGPMGQHHPHHHHHHQHHYHFLNIGRVEGGLLLHDNHTDGCHSWDPAHHHHQVIGPANACSTNEMTNHLFSPGLANTDEELHHREGRNTTTTDTLLDLLTNCFPPNLVQVVFSFFAQREIFTHRFGPVGKS